MKARFCLTAIAAAAMAMGTVMAQTAHADLSGWVLVDQYTEINPDTLLGTGGYAKIDGCGSTSSVGSYRDEGTDTSHIGVRTYFAFDWYGSGSGAGAYSFDLTGSIYGSVSGMGPYWGDEGADGTSGSGVGGLNDTILISDTCGGASSSLGPINANYGPSSVTQNNASDPMHPAPGNAISLDVSSYADSHAHSIARAGAIAISSTTVNINNVQQVP